MKKIISIHQPQYFPWMGLLEKVALSDTFLLLDNVQFNKRSFQNRALYSTTNGEKYITIPVKSKNHQISILEICDLQFAEDKNKICHQHFESLRHRYSKTKGWKKYNDRIYDFYKEDFKSAYELIYNSMLLTFELFGIEKEIIKSSELNVNGKKNELLINLILKTDNRIYLSGSGAKDYMDEKLFKEQGIEVLYQDFKHPIYKQSHQNRFIKGCMALDYLFENPEEAIDYIGSIRK